MYFFFFPQCRQAVSEEQRLSSERADRMRADLESLELRLEEEKERSAQLLLQVIDTPPPPLSQTCTQAHASVENEQRDANVS